MNVGMNLLLWTDRPTAAEHGPLLEKLKTWGYDGVEFPTAGMTPEDIREMARRCDDLGLGRTTILALDAAQADPASSDAALREAAVTEITRVVDQAVAIGASILAGPLFQGLGRFTGTAPTESEWQWAQDAIRQAGEYAAEHDVQLALEPLNRFEMYMVNTMADGARFVRGVALDNVGLLADTHHSNIEENDTIAAWQDVVEHIVHVHISENHRGIPGSGHAIPPALFGMLEQQGYTVWLTIEAFGLGVPGLIPRLFLWRMTAPNEDAVAEQGLRFLRERLAESAAD